MKEYDEVWSLKAGEVEAFFDGQYEDVSVIPLPDKMIGALTLPQTRIIIKGESAEEIYHQFRLHFLKAGG